MLEDIEQSPTEKISIRTLGLKFGIVSGLLMIIYSLIINVSGLHANRAISFLNWLMVISIVIWTHSEFKKSNHFMSYSQGLGLGVLVIGIGGLIASMFGVIYMTLIDPNFVKNMLIIIREQATEQNPNLSDEQIDSIMSFTEVFFKPHWMFLLGIFLYTFMGTIVAAIVSIFTKKTNPDPFQ